MNTEFVTKNFVCSNIEDITLFIAQVLFTKHQNTRTLYFNYFCDKLY